MFTEGLSELDIEKLKYLNVIQISLIMRIILCFHFVKKTYVEISRNIAKFQKIFRKIL